ncbi:CHAP domain-containing protein [Massilia sp. CCM 8734]|uniref:CHAP domain-containing protein n=1 Tax=Massilia sp. CCM 8734 TaxID=2609283 RepID=UPI00141EB1EC|nr:CHAP domain-containing protein [Massilia sp. CCM 8734]NHZ94767.1 CHAP domain-containing protein [Massilia sp. CCM 8734]
MPWNVNAAVAHLNSHAMPASTSNCAKFVRQAIAAGGVTVVNTNSAKDYGIRLTNAGFVAVQGAPRAGDVAVIQPIPGHPDGHMTMYNGTQWVSDYKQPAVHGYYPSPAYRQQKPPVTFYRKP